jgi:hypothetical protein
MIGEFLSGAVARDVKKAFADLVLWNARTGADLKAVFERLERVLVSRSGWRTAKDILKCF